MSVHTFKRATVNDTVNRGLSAYGSKVDNSMCACPECEGLGGTGFMKCENCKGTGKVLNEKYKGWTIKRDGEGYTILDANGDEVCLTGHSSCLLFCREVSSFTGHSDTAFAVGA